LAALLIYGPLFAVLTGVAAAFSEVFVHGNSTGGIAVVPGAALWIAFAYVALAFILVRLRATGPIRTTTAAVRFATVASIGTLIIAMGYVGVFLIGGQLRPEDGVRAVARYWFADLNGILMVTPLLLQASDGSPRWPRLWNHKGVVLGQVAWVIATLALLFWLPEADQLRFFYLLFVPIIWVALRWKLSGAVFGVLAIQVGLIIAAHTGIHTPRFIDLQFLLVTLAITALLLGAVVTEREDDAADRRRAEEQLRESDAALARAMRFAVAGELASALAHELNQPITAVVSYLRALKILAEPIGDKDPRLQSTLSKADEAAIRASEVLRRLRDFYSGGESKQEAIDMGAVCSGVARAFQERLRRAEVMLEVNADSAIPRFTSDRMQIEIVLHNLIANAIDAVSQTDAASRRIRLSAAASANAVILSVDDSGPGITSSAAESLFEPFMTSKPDGMGLGLAISRSLIRARGGELSFARSATLGGACFTVHWPLEPPTDIP
jgi:two-component system sensor kinase FixL